MDMLTNIRTEGTGVPMANPEMLAAQAAPQGPMMDPGMSNPAAELMAMQGMQQEESVSIDGDAAMLAEAVVSRADGNLQAAVAILDNAKSMIMGAGEEPQMMMGGGYMKPQNYVGGGALKSVPEGNKGLAKLPENVRNRMGYMADGGALQEGRDMSDMDILRAVIANSQKGRDISDKDISMTRQILEGQQGRTMSDADVAMNRTFSDNDLVQLAAEKLMRYRSS